MGFYHRWTAAELKKIIEMLQNPEFDSKDIDPDYGRSSLQRQSKLPF
jgi:hypothetical protein